MQTLARVNRTVEGKPDGLLVAYAPLGENLEKALAEYTDNDRKRKPVARDIDEAAVETRKLVAQLARWWSVASGDVTLAELLPTVQSRPCVTCSPRDGGGRLLVKYKYPPDKQPGRSGS